MRNGGLSAVSCAGPSACIAVGGYENRFGAGLSLAERWDGDRWTSERVPAPAGSIWSGLYGVSCASATFCLAVGWYVTDTGREAALAERWDAGRWAVQPVPAPAGSADTGLFAISCSSPRFCAAVGASLTGAPRELALAERWDGRRWSAQPVPAPAGGRGSEFGGISCGSPGACTAVGAVITRTGQAATLAQRWNGRTWRIQETAMPRGALGAALNAVSCWSPRGCTAVGDFGSAPAGGRPATLAETWDGVGWRIQATPRPEGADGVSLSVLSGISCARSAACTAVGGYEPQPGLEATLAMASNGGRWAVQRTPNPARSLAAGLSAVSCAPAGACAGVGSYEVQFPLTAVPGAPIPARTMAETWHGARWTLQPTRNRDGAAVFSEFRGVSCASARACAAIGDYLTGAGLFAPLAERWNGARWAIQPTPDPSPGAETFLDGISCPSARYCTAVGFSTSVSDTRAVAERWNGVRWRVQPTPPPAHGTGARLSSIWCVSARTCMAVGDHVRGPVPLAEEWNGARWRALAVPAPPGARQASLSGVSCTTATACVAVGYYSDALGRQLALAEQWDGARWQLRAAARPVGAVLNGVSCATSRACAAIGARMRRNGRELALAEEWNGRDWAIKPTPSVSSYGSWLNAVSCLPARACTAVGAYQTADKSTVLMAESRESGRWVRESAASPAAAFDSSLGAISCAAAGACAAAGSDLALTNVTVTLALAASG